MAFDVDLSSQDKYAVEFDLALTKSSKDDVQFVVASGTMPTANTGMTSNYIFKIKWQVILITVRLMTLTRQP